MATEAPTLFNAVVARLEDRAVPFALIGAVALAVHGIGRSTFDVDLLVTDRAVLDQKFWTRLGDISMEIRRGDESDPLAGVVRCRTPGQRDVDLVVGKSRWMADVVRRAVAVSYAGRPVPVVLVPDLILLKLYAGGAQDRWDVVQLLNRTDRETITAEVGRGLLDLPPTVRQLWSRIVAEE